MILRHQRIHQVFLSKKIYFCLFLTFISTACSYRFTNYYSQIPGNARSIAFESIYDISRNVIAHELIWHELQKKFAENGRLIITSKKQADLLLRAQLSESATFQFGRQQSLNEQKDPTDIFADPEAITPRQLRDLSRAWNLASQEQTILKVDIEIWDLRSKNIIYSNSFKRTHSYRIPQVRNKAIVHLRSEEVKDDAITRIANDIADHVIRGFIHKI